ncbi:MAG TPA: hypothetical protein VII58_07525 [Acidobacteriaceae bacterium]
MPDLSFSQPERRNFLVPAVVVITIMAIAFALVYFFLPHRTVDAQVTHVSFLPLHTSYSNGSRVIGRVDASEDDLYVLATVRVHDQLGIPLFIKDLTGAVATQDSTDITTSAVEKNDLASVYEALPSLKSMSGPPLLREIEIAPGATAEGMVMLHYSLTEAAWKQRKSASITIDFYHQDPITVAIPQS